MDPKYSMWISTDPALGDYIPKAPINEEAKRHNQNLPGMGGVFNAVNLNLYHYAGNNPVKYVDPTGMFEIDVECKTITANMDDKKDIAAARKEFGKNNDLEKFIVKNDKQSVIFNNWNAVDDFINNDGFKIFEEIYSKLSDGVGLATVANSSKALGKLGSGFTFASVGLDGVHTYLNIKNGNKLGAISSGADVIIDMVGFAGPPGTLASIGLKYTKQGVIFSAKQAALANEYLEASFLNMISNYLFGVNIK